MNSWSSSSSLWTGRDGGRCAFEGFRGGVELSKTTAQGEHKGPGGAPINNSAHVHAGEYLIGSHLELLHWCSDGR